MSGAIANSTKEITVPKGFKRDPYALNLGNINDAYLGCYRLRKDAHHRIYESTS